MEHVFEDLKSCQVLRMKFTLKRFQEGVTAFASFYLGI